MALFSAIPASSDARAVTLGAGVEGSNGVDNGLVVLAATAKVSPEVMKACHHFRNRSQRHKCQQEHMHKM